jgi:hypothetical protein
VRGIGGHVAALGMADTQRGWHCQPHGGSSLKQLLQLSWPLGFLQWQSGLGWVQENLRAHLFGPYPSFSDWLPLTWHIPKPHKAIPRVLGSLWVLLLAYTGALRHSPEAVPSESYSATDQSGPRAQEGLAGRGRQQQCVSSD